MANAPPTVGKWNMFYARFIRLVAKHKQRPDAAGTFARRLQAEMGICGCSSRRTAWRQRTTTPSGWLRFAVLWRTRSLGTRNASGERWVERALSPRQTCRLQGKRTYEVLVEVMNALFSGRDPDLSWIQTAKGVSP